MVFLSSRRVPLDRLQERMSPASPWMGGRSWTRAGGRAAGAGLVRRPSVFRARGCGGLVVGTQRVFGPGAPSRSRCRGRGPEGGVSPAGLLTRLGGALEVCTL